MNWQEYIVHTSSGRTLTIRGISHRDVAYVFANPCKRNDNAKLAHDGEVIEEIEVPHATR